MVKSYEPTFEILLTHNTRLETIDLARNNIESIPNNFFNGTNNMKHMLLSGNSISQITFDIESMGNIEVLDLSYNSINSLSQKSRERISSRISPNLSVILDGNPLSCAVCEDYAFIQWLLLDSTPIINRHNLTCRNDHLENEKITNVTLTKLEDICNAPLQRRKVIILSTVATVLSLTVVVIVVGTRNRCIKRWNYVRRLQEAKRLLQRGNGAYTYAVFLYFCDDDTDIVNRHVMQNLEEALSRRLTTQRILVKTSADIEHGHSILDEIVKHLELSSLVACVLSDAFLMSEYSQMEILPAKHTDKPFLFFVKGQINAGGLTPWLEVLYQKSPKVVWSTEDKREYTMETSWDNVSDLIVKLIADAIQQTPLIQEPSENRTDERTPLLHNNM
ncbi:hypothetical protein DPMN_174917 [Dreissena polymorpha]|uniref:TIR domain-containing protein n=1 Tax=Dreissena polymorpha TaxID=45954 RepID=A0A9D4IGT1_DREPO|nr:hypothetical protein DPMN_174917 [Dreissena polymorpha]